MSESDSEADADADVKVIEVEMPHVRDGARPCAQGRKRTVTTNDTGIRCFTKTAQWGRGMSGVGVCPTADEQWGMFSGASVAPIIELMAQQIQTKLSGYRSQDVEKGMYDAAAFIDYDTVKEALIACNMCCRYCNARVKILYDEVRDRTQWTVDRIHNGAGHNKGNFVIACLGCNLHRRCRRADEYNATKRMVIVKVE